MRKDKLKLKKKEKKNIPVGVVYINSTLNNIIVTFTDKVGNKVAASSGGQHGLTGSKKATPYAAEIVAEKAGRAAMECGMNTIAVVFKGHGNGRETAARALLRLGFCIVSYRDKTPLPHNGCRPPKRRRN
jgi:small subunit ribosomal protein S11